MPQVRIPSPTPASLPFVERSGGGIRMFKDEDIGWLSIIECLKKTGMPIKEIKRKLHERMNGKKNKIFAVFSR